MSFDKIITYTLRVIDRNRAYSAINLLGLSLGLTIFTLIVLFVRYEFGYDEYQVNYDRIYRIVRDGESDYLGSSRFAVVSAPTAGAIKETVREADHVSRIAYRGTLLVTVNENSFLEDNYRAVDPEFFNIFSVEVVAGDKDQLLANPTDIVLDRSTAIKYFGSVEGAIGQTLNVQGWNPIGDYVVQSVIEEMPFRSHFRATMLFAFEPYVKIIQPRDLEQWDSNNYWLAFTLREGTDVSAAQDRLNAYLAPKLVGRENPPRAIFQPLSDVHLGEYANFDLNATGNKDQLYIFVCIGILVLVIACINYINMATARATNRAKEIGVRKVNGALRVDLIIQFMFEAFASVIVAAVVAIGTVWLLLPAYNAFLSKEMSMDILLEPTSVMFAVGLIVSVALIAGSYPALLFSAFKPIHVLKGRFHQSHNSKMRNVLVVFQFVVSGTLVFCTLIVWKQMELVKNKDLGFNREHIITVRLRDQAHRHRIGEIKQMLLSNSAISAVSGSMSLPTGMGSNTGRNWQGKNGEQHLSIYINQVDPDFIDLYEMKLIAGSNLAPTSRSRERSMDIVVNETLVRELGFSNDEILNREFIRPTIDTFRVIGVVADFHYRDFKLKIEPMELRAFDWGPPNYLSIKVQGVELQSVVDHIRTTLASISDKYPFEYSYYDDVYNKTFLAEAKTSKLMTVFSVVAIAIAALGLYGLILHMVNQRMKEIGIRKTLGAGRMSIIRLLSGKFGALILIGYAIACGIGYYGIEKWLEGFAYRVSPTAVDFIVTLVAIALIAGLAVSSRVATALRINPATVLKQE